MTAKERDELLVRLDERTSVTKEKVEKLDATINGNGKVGMKERFDVVELNQQNCFKERHQRKLDLKWFVIIAIAIIEILIIFKGV